MRDARDPRLVHCYRDANLCVPNYANGIRKATRITGLRSGPPHIEAQVVKVHIRVGKAYLWHVLKRLHRSYQSVTKRLGHSHVGLDNICIKSAYHASVFEDFDLMLKLFNEPFDHLLGEIRVGIRAQLVLPFGNDFLIKGLESPSAYRVDRSTSTL